MTNCKYAGLGIFLFGVFIILNKCILLLWTKPSIYHFLLTEDAGKFEIIKIDKHVIGLVTEAFRS